MWRKPENKDEETQVLISRVTRKMNRKTLLNKFAQRILKSICVKAIEIKNKGTAMMRRRFMLNWGSLI